MSTETTVWACYNDTYCHDTEIFETVEEFAAMCEAVYGVAPVLKPAIRASGSVMVDEEGSVVLREVRS